MARLLEHLDQTLNSQIVYDVIVKQTYIDL